MYANPAQLKTISNRQESSASQRHFFEDGNSITFNRNSQKSLNSKHNAQVCEKTYEDSSLIIGGHLISHPTNRGIQETNSSDFQLYATPQRVPQNAEDMAEECEML